MARGQISRSLSIALVGAGQMGRKHLQAVAMAGDEIVLDAIVDPDPDAAELARAYNASWYPSLSEMLQQARPDGVVLATPNSAHVEGALRCIAEGCPVLVEKPIAVDVSSAEHLVVSAANAGVALMVGHHRRHNPVINRARKEIAAGSIGRILSVHANAWFHKPGDYFDIEWHREPNGGGPLLINLIHDIDLLQYFCGLIEDVAAFRAENVRGYPVEETVAISLRFSRGAVGTMNLSDTIVAPWSWEMTARENDGYPATDEFCCLLGGTHGALELPSLRLWRHAGNRNWHEPIVSEYAPHERTDPLVRQLRHFAGVIAGRERPLVTGLDGLAALRVVAAIRQSMENGGSAVAVAHSKTNGGNAC